MNIQENVSLKQYSSMRLGGNARYFSEVKNRNELPDLVNWAKQNSLPIIMIGTGTNIVWKDEGFNGLLLVNKMLGIETFEEDSENLYVTASAGENWDHVVERFTDMGYSGIETLSLIPGNVGATPIQNVGAYGGEISNVLVSVEAYDSKVNQLVTIPNTDCGFGYRTSRFKLADHGRFYITSVTLHLTKINPAPPYYPAVQDYIDAHKITEITPKVIRQAVIYIRQSKLPDPTKVPNCGSFFKNPIITPGDLKVIQGSHQDVPYWQTDDGSVKVSAAWLIESAGFKNFNDPETGISTWPNQALVFVNKSAKSTADLLKFKQKVVDKVMQLYQIKLEQEPELLPLN